MENISFLDVTDERAKEIVKESLAFTAYKVVAENSLDPKSIIEQLLARYEGAEKLFCSYIFGRYYEEHLRLEKQSTLSNIMKFVDRGMFEDVEQCIAAVSSKMKVFSRRPKEKANVDVKFKFDENNN